MFACEIIRYSASLFDALCVDFGLSLALHYIIGIIYRFTVPFHIQISHNYTFFFTKVQKKLAIPIFFITFAEK